MSNSKFPNFAMTKNRVKLDHSKTNPIFSTIFSNHKLEAFNIFIKRDRLKCKLIDLAEMSENRFKKRKKLAKKKSEIINFH